VYQRLLLVASRAAALAAAVTKTDVIPDTETVSGAAEASRPKPKKPKKPRTKKGQ